MSVDPSSSWLSPSGTDEATGDGLADEGPFLVVVPTYEEADNVGRLLPRILEQDERLHVLVVDDASPDGTADAVERLAAERGDGRVHVLRRPGKLGLGSAYIDGFRWGLEREYSLFFEMDADFSHNPAHLPQFLRAIADHDLVLGARYLEGRVTVVNWPISRLLLSYFGSLYARIITGVPLHDLTTGFKCFRRRVLETLDLDAVESEGYAFQIEMTFRTWRAGFSVGQIPIVFVERAEGESKMSGRIVREAVWKVWKFRLLDLLGRLEPGVDAPAGEGSAGE